MEYALGVSPDQNFLTSTLGGTVPGLENVTALGALCKQKCVWGSVISRASDFSVSEQWDN